MPELASHNVGDLDLPHIAIRAMLWDGGYGISLLWDPDRVAAPRLELVH